MPDNAGRWAVGWVRWADANTNAGANGDRHARADRDGDHQRHQLADRHADARGAAAADGLALTTTTAPVARCAGAECVVLAGVVAPTG